MKYTRNILRLILAGTIVIWVFVGFSMAQETQARLESVPRLPDPAFQYQKPLPDYLLVLSPKEQPSITNEGGGAWAGFVL